MSLPAVEYVAWGCEMRRASLSFFRRDRMSAIVKGSGWQAGVKLTSDGEGKEGGFERSGF